MNDHATFLPDLDITIPNEGTLSKVVYKDDRIRVVAFAFDEGQELTEHTAASPATIHIVSGRFRMTLGTETVEAGTGSWTHMPAQLPHSVLALEPSIMLLTLLK